MMTFIKKTIQNIDKDSIAEWIVLFVCAANLEIMHRSLSIDANIHRNSIFEHIAYIILDVLILFVFSSFISWKRKRICLSLMFACSWIWGIVNTIYGHVFKTYIPFSIIGEFNSMQDPLVINSTLGALKLIDLLYIINLLLFIGALVSIEPTKRFSFKSVTKGVGITFLIALILSKGSVLENGYNKIVNYEKCQLEVKLWDFVLTCNNYANGFFFSQLYYETNNLFRIDELTKEEKKQISYIIDRHKKMNVSDYDAYKDDEPQHIFFILVESYLSVSSDLIVANKEITPYLNSLKKDTTTYYNGKVESQISIGESSDGQFIYMTGLLPLSHDLTVNRLKDKTVRALPTLLKGQDHSRLALMTIPTKRDIWRQAAVCETYGFDSLFSTFDEYKKELTNDEYLFSLALKKTLEHRDEKTFHVILTLSTHNPYDKPVEEATGSFNFPQTYSTEYCNYLKDLNYMDSCLGSFMESLKKEELYDHSCFIIVSDHEAHPEMLKMSSEALNNLYLPFYIVNCKNKPSGYHGEIQQIDVMSTIADMFVPNSSWTGLGCSVFMGDSYKRLNKDLLQSTSNSIIEGNFFKDIRH